MISVAGHTAIDHICRVPSLPPPNTSMEIADHQVFFGGGAANIAAGIARLGGATTLVSAVGGDFRGSDYERWLESLGVRLNLYRIPDAHTATAFMFTDDRGDQVTFFEWGASRIFSETEPPALPFVHMATADPAFNVKLAGKAEFSSFDPGQDLYRYSKGQLLSILSRASILFANHHEVDGMCRILSLGRTEIANLVPMAVFTRGREGSSLLVRGEVERKVPALPVRMVDPTGAGDAYRAGFLTAYARGLDPLTCTKIGTTTASFVVEAPGCQTRLPDWETMRERYLSSFGPDSEVTG
ncbi:MAG: carbohydrate kinase family protein [Methanoregulaceae archaeon]|nr:carbohydrate kinase family protein [Methanoregulaceae archaeon]